MVWLHRGLAISLLVVVLLIVFGNRFYETIQRPLWSENAAAKSYVIDQLHMKDITEIDRFVGDRVYTVIFATNSADEKVIVWLWDGGRQVKHASSGLSREEAAQRALADQPGKHIKRVMPGKLRDDLVWEVFYTKTEDGAERYYYDYYRFSDGTKLDTYRLAKSM
jgi:uncharacterized protein YpmB